MTTRDFVLLWQAAAVLAGIATVVVILRAPRDRRPLYWTILLGWTVAAYAWDVNINFVGHVEYSDHWYMAFSVNGKAEPALAPLIYMLWFVLPAVVLLENRDRFERVLGRRHLWWIFLGTAVWSFYLDFAATSFRPVWTYYQRYPFVLEYPMMAPFMNALLTMGAYLLFRQIDRRRRERDLGVGGLAWRSTIAANTICAGVYLLVFSTQRIPALESTLLQYVKSQ